MIDNQKIANLTQAKINYKFNNLNYDISYTKIIKMGFWIFVPFVLIAIAFLIIFNFTSEIAYTILWALGLSFFIIAIIAPFITSIIAVNMTNKSFKKELDNSYLEIILSIINSLNDWQINKTEKDCIYFLKYQKNEITILANKKPEVLSTSNIKKELELTMFTNDIKWKYSKLIKTRLTYFNSLLNYTSQQINKKIIKDLNVIVDFIQQGTNENK